MRYNRGSCSLCDERPADKRIVDVALTQLRTPNYIELHWQELGLSRKVKSETVMRHRAHSGSEQQPLSKTHLRDQRAVKRAERTAFVSSVLGTNTNAEPSSENSLPTPSTSEGNLDVSPQTPQASSSVSPSPYDQDDIATLVRTEAAERLRNGELRVTTQHALQAQQILDRREEKSKDRDLIIAFGRLMTAVLPPARVLPQLPPPTDYIEGESTEVND